MVPQVMAPAAAGEPAIICDGLGKAYQLYQKRTDRLKQVVLGGFGRFYTEYWALNRVDLTIRRGEAVGIVGRNGAGKSTLLQLLCGITQPTRGVLTVNGRIAPILALGAGFSADMSGRENVMVGGTILGLRRAEIAKRMESIADFAGIGGFIDQPVRLYSAGMRSRLAFAICAHVDADILIVDEALSVGDGVFRQKCLDFIRQFCVAGTLVLVTHEMDQIEALCQRVIWIDQGAVREEGPPGEIIPRYIEVTGNEPDVGRRIGPPRLPKKKLF